MGLLGIPPPPAGVPAIPKGRGRETVTNTTKVTNSAKRRNVLWSGNSLGQIWCGRFSQEGLLS